MRTTLVDIARSNNMFPNAVATPKGTDVELKLDGASSISFPSEYDQEISKGGINSELAKKVGFAFRKFAEKIITNSELQIKIQKIFEKNKTPNKTPVRRTYNLIEALEKHVVDNEIACIKKAKDKALLLFIGKSGAGKSTATNHLLGCKMKYIDQKDLGGTGASGKIIVAENPVSKIGINPKKSKTTIPEVVQVPEQIIGKNEGSWVICDCPGFGENRGAWMEIQNSISILETYKVSKGIKGFVIFFECSKIMDDKCSGIKENMKYLQLLMKDFNKYKQSVLFIVTKVRDVKLVDIKITLKESVQEIADPNYPDEELSLFCEQIINSGILDDAMGSRVLIADPMGAKSSENRNEILNSVKGFSSNITPPKEGGLGYAISSDGLAKSEITKLSNKTHALTTITKLKNELAPFWNKKIGHPSNSKATKDTVDLALQCMDEMDKQWLPKKITLELLAHDPLYISVSKNYTDHLDRFLSFWDNANKIGSKQEKVDDDNMQVQHQEIEKKLREIREQMVEIWHQRMHEVLMETFEKTLQSHPVQSGLGGIKAKVDLSNLMNLQTDELCKTLASLDVLTNAALPYKANIGEILKKNERATQLKNLIKLNILDTIEIGSQNDQITVVAKAQKVALSAILPKVGQFGAVTSLLIQAKTPSKTGTLYFDHDLGTAQFRNVDWITIDADQIQVKGKLWRVNPDVVCNTMGFPRLKAIHLMGNFNGTSKIESKELQLAESSDQSSLGIRCVWPL